MYRLVSLNLMFLFTSYVSGGIKTPSNTVDNYQPKSTIALATCSETVPSSCTTNGCTNCKLQRKCLSGESQFTNCISSELCNNGGCTPRSTDIPCSCFGKPDGTYPDPYNPQIFLTCVNGQENFQFCGVNEIYSSSLGKCFALPDCNELGCKAIPEDCQAFYCCQKNGAGFTQEINMCDIGEVYDDVLKRCIPTQSIICTTPGPKRDPYKCDVYYVCSMSGDTNPAAICCSIGFMYSETSLNCVPDDGSCPQIGICYDSYFETNICNRCTNDIDRFPSKTQCTKYYYQCEATSSGFVEELTDCPDPLIYNPAYGYCDLSSNVAGCVSVLSD